MFPYFIGEHIIVLNLIVNNLLRISRPTIITDWTVVIFALVRIVVLGVQNARPQHEDVFGLAHSHQAWKQVPLDF